MLITESVLLSSEVSRDGTQFSIKAMEDALALKAVVGTPSCLGHDSTIPIGWNVPIALYFEPHLCRLTGKGQIAETDADQGNINAAFRANLIKRYSENCGPYLETFNAELKDCYSGNQTFLSSTLVSCFDENIVVRRFPKLFEKLDKNGLIYLADLLKQFDYLGHGVFKDKKSKFAICAHQYFRKSLSRHNNLNYFFLDHFLSFRDHKDIVLRLKIDQDIIGLAETFVPAMEFEYWHGPRFKEAVPDIANEVTVHGMDQFNRIFNGVDRTEFYRKIESGEQTFEIEEIKYLPSMGISAEDFGCRYIHSQFDVKTKNFKHFDGAIRLYDKTKMDVRNQRNIKNAGKDALYTKLFRIDGQLPLSAWQGLIHNYFQGNNLIEEYFTGHTEPPQTKYQNSEARYLSKSVLPIRFRPEDGLRIAASYTSADDIDFDEYSHFLIGYDIFNGGERKVAEADTIEVKKELQKLGYKLEIPTAIEFADCINTAVLNIPAILVRNDDRVHEYISATLLAISGVLSSKKFTADTVTFTIKWKKDETIVVGVSVAGHKATILDWIQKNPAIPTEHEAFRTWLEDQHEQLSQYEANIDVPHLFDILNDDGVLYISRKAIGKYINASTFEMQPDGRYNFEIKDEFRESFDPIKDTISIAEVVIIKKSKCTNCGEDYQFCHHSRLTEDTEQKIEDFEAVGFCWVEKIP